MQIFSEIMNLCVQLAFGGNVYKNNLQNLSFNKNLNSLNFQKNVSYDQSKILDEPLKKASMNYKSVSSDGGKYRYSGDFSGSFKDFYESLEFDARRYNRNFDSQTGAFSI